MRELKFRIWDSTEKEMLFDACPCDANSPHYPDWTWMQFTGLLDKQGVEIYEGDIVEFDPVYEYTPLISSVIYDVETASFELERGPYLTDAKDHATVRGNIYEHKHLLNET